MSEVPWVTPHGVRTLQLLCRCPEPRCVLRTTDGRSAFLYEHDGKTYVTDILVEKPIRWFGDLAASPYVVLE